MRVYVFSSVVFLAGPKRWIFFLLIYMSSFFCEPCVFTFISSAVTLPVGVLTRRFIFLLIAVSAYQFALISFFPCTTVFMDNLHLLVIQTFMLRNLLSLSLVVFMASVINRHLMIFIWVFACATALRVLGLQTKEDELLEVVLVLVGLSLSKMDISLVALKTWCSILVGRTVDTA